MADNLVQMKVIYNLSRWRDLHDRTFGDGISTMDVMADVMQKYRYAMPSAR